jgi:glycosyltransferase involved in cell wall biosynthesis
LKENIKENIHLIIRSLYNGKNILDKLDRIKNKNPPICTHDVENNIIIEKLRENNLNNDRNNYVKVILPVFDFGIFLSRYEPYGYTPLEALNNFVPIVLSNKTGFYRNLISKNINHEYIISVDPHNLDKEFIYNKFLQYYNLDLYEKMEIKKQMYDISKKFDWKNNINEYINIYDSM